MAKHWTISPNGQGYVTTYHNISWFLLCYDITDSMKKHTIFESCRGVRQEVYHVQSKPYANSKENENQHSI